MPNSQKSENSSEKNEKNDSNSNEKIEKNNKNDKNDKNNSSEKEINNNEIDKEKSKKYEKNEKNEKNEKKSNEKNSKKHKKHKKSYSKSRSHSRRHKKKHSKKHKSRHHKKNSHRSRSRGRGRARHRSKSKSSEKRERTNSEERRQKYFEERRRLRSRSPSPYLSYRIRRSPSPFRRNHFNSMMDPAGPRKFWDGFQWVVKTNSLPTQDPEVMNQTKKMRKIQISNLPMYLGLTEKDIRIIVTKFLIDNYLNDRECTLNSSNQTAMLELSSVEETNRMIKLDTIKIFNQNCKITRVGEGNAMVPNLTTISALVNNAQTSARAQAAAIAAMELIKNKDTKTTFNIGGGPSTSESTVLKVNNIVTQEKAVLLSERDFQYLENEVFKDFQKFGTILNIFMIRPAQVTIGAQLGSIFIEFSTHQEAKAAYSDMNNRKFEVNEMKIVFIPMEIYTKNFLPLKMMMIR